LLRHLTCRDNMLSSLPNYPNLLLIDCKNNNITTLPRWPRVEYVSCARNQLRDLPAWPCATVIWCDHNQLTALPVWPRADMVSCSHNQLTTLPAWPRLDELFCSANPLQVLPEIATLTKVHSDLWLHRIPNLPKIITFSSANVSIEHVRAITKLCCAVGLHYLRRCMRRQFTYARARLWWWIHDDIVYNPNVRSARERLWLQATRDCA
jgi:hypothetical protein